MKKRRLNQQEILDYLKDYPGASETEIQLDVWNYNRSTSWEANKKYADILRRALGKGVIKRLKVKLKDGSDKATYRYCLAAQSFDVIFKQIKR